MLVSFCALKSLTPAFCCLYALGFSGDLKGCLEVSGVFSAGLGGVGRCPFFLGGVGSFYDLA